MYTTFMLPFEVLHAVFPLFATFLQRSSEYLFFFIYTRIRVARVQGKRNRIKSLFPSGKRERERESGRGYKGLFET